VKILLFSVLFFVSLVARDNPFSPLYDTPSQIEDNIPILNITTNPIFTNTQKVKLVKKVPLPTVQIVEQTPAPHTSTIEPTQILVQTTMSEPIMMQIDEVTPHKYTKPKKKRERKKKKRSYNTIYQNYFLKIMTNGKNIKIITQDTLIEKRNYKSPLKVSFDFDRLQYFRTKSIALHNPYAKRLKIGSHHDFYRITLMLKNKKTFKIQQTAYGYLLVLN
jgi:hypothetical protein